MRVWQSGSVLLLLAAAGCSHEARAPVHPPETRAERLAVLDRIAAECHVPRATLVLVGEDELRLQVRPDEQYEHVACMLNRLDAVNIPRQHMGFVGNELIQPDNGHAPAH
jgi:hypothetical protein